MDGEEKCLEHGTTIFGWRHIVLFSKAVHRTRLKTRHVHVIYCSEATRAIKKKF